MDATIDWKKLEDALAEHYGWAASPAARELINAAIAGKAERLRVAPQEYCNLAAASQSELLALVEETEVGESYFFRELSQFDYLRAVVLPELLARQTPESYPRLWSAACATGEEPYSLALVCAQLGLAKSGKQVEIFATDVRNRALLAASRASYQAEALRLLDAATREQYFEQVSASYQLRQSIRRLVIFRRINLLDALFWKGVVQRFDLIVCANLLYRLHGPAVRQMIANLTNALHEGGYLMVAPAETFLVNAPRLKQMPDAPSFFQKI